MEGSVDRTWLVVSLACAVGGEHARPAEPLRAACPGDLEVRPIVAPRAKPAPVYADDGTLYLIWNDATSGPSAKSYVRQARRDPVSGAWSAAAVTPTTQSVSSGGGSCRPALHAVGDATTRRVVAAWTVSTTGGSVPDRYQVWEG